MYKISNFDTVYPTQPLDQGLFHAVVHAATAGDDFFFLVGDGDVAGGRATTFGDDLGGGRKGVA